MESARKSTPRAPQGGRGPRYRTSCDNCQAAKIKCGHDKPSCRRCSVQGLECVYSLSRRMGRPRQTREPAARTDSRRTPPATMTHDGSQSDQPMTPSLSQTGVEKTAPTQNITAPERNPRSPLSAGGPNRPTCIPRSLIDDFQPGHIFTNSLNEEQPGSQPQLDTWDSSFPTPSPIAFDGFPSLAELPTYPDDTISNPTMSGTISSAPRTGFPEQQDIFEPGLPTALGDDIGSLDGRIDRELRPVSATTEHNCSGLDFYTQASHGNTGSTSTAALMEQLVDMDFDCFPDISGGSSRSTNSSSIPASILRQDSSLLQDENTSSALNFSSRADFLPLDEEGWSRSQESTDRKKYNCDCSSAISKDIGQLCAEQQKATTMSIDRALKMESEIEATLTRFLRCEDCCRHDSIMHLLAFTSVEMTLDLLQETTRHEFKLPRSNRLYPSQGSAVSRPRHHHQQASVEVCNLYIGSYKVAPGARLRFLRRVLQARFHKLAEFIRDREKILDGLKQDCAARAAALLLEDISRGLHTITGWIEVWGR